MTHRTFFVAWVCAILLAPCAQNSFAATPADSHFTDTIFVSNPAKLGERGDLPPTTDGQVNGITSMEWSPDGANRLYVTIKGRSNTNALIQVIRDGIIQSVPFYRFDTGLETHNECGLMSLVFHPDYAAGTRQLYCFITVSKREQQILRFNEITDPHGNFVAAGPPTPVVTGIPTHGAVHNGGGLAIAPDQNGHGRFLYWACGNLGVDRGHQLNTNSLASKIGRANLNGSIPTDGLNASGYVWAFGYRNPFSMTVQPGTGKLWVNDVGELYEQIFVPTAGSWAGDKDYENNLPPPNPLLRARQISPIVKYRTSSVDKRMLAAENAAVRNGNIVTYTTTVPHRFAKGELITLTGITPPSFNKKVYVLATPSENTFTAESSGVDSIGSGGMATTQNIGSAITGGAFNDKSTWPADYRGNYFFGDFISGRISRVQLNPDNSVKQVDSFLTGANQIIDISFGPDGAMYYALTGPGAIHKVTYNALVITTTSPLPTAMVGAAYNQNVSIAESSEPLTWSLASGSLPAGLKLDPSTGAIHGTATSPGTSHFQVSVTNSSKGKGQRDFTLVVQSEPQLAKSTRPAASIGAEATSKLTAESYGLAARPLASPYLGMNPAALPATLRETGVFSDHRSLKPAPALIPYTVNSAFFSDGAAKLRWISVPNSGPPYSAAEQIGFAPTGEWTFPPGTVLVKHFELNIDDHNRSLKKRLETRLLFVHENGAVSGATYKWRDDETNADLLPDSLDEDIAISTASGSTRTQRWHFPSKAECLQCHNPAAGGVLGLKTRQQNGNFTYPQTRVTDNQLRTWNHIGLFKVPIDETKIPSYPKLVPVTHTEAPLELRVRSYLDANCSNCHRPGGGAPAAFDARFDTTLDKQNILIGQISRDLGIKNAKVILPRDTERSMLYVRLKGADPTSSMPPIARNVADNDAIATIETWINSLPETGLGLTAEYFVKPDLTDPILTRVDGTIDFDLQWGVPHPTVPIDSFSIRWTGEIQPQFSETYTFTTKTDDGARLWINGQLLIDKWNEGTQEGSGTIELKAGQKYPIKMEYFQHGNGASAKLMWSSPSTKNAVVPRSALFK